MERKILQLAKNKSQLMISKPFYNNKIIIVDFFNLYCSITHFSKFRTFSRETYIHCMNLILEKFKNNKLYIVSKNIFEIERSYIVNLTREHQNLSYIIVEDTYEGKSQNRERDDYACLLINDNLSRKGTPPLLITNDKLRNLSCLVKIVKPMKLLFYQNKSWETFEIKQDFIDKNCNLLEQNGIPETAEFIFERKKI
jgi:hypothetical protein